MTLRVFQLNEYAENLNTQKAAITARESVLTMQEETIRKRVEEIKLKEAALCKRERDLESRIQLLEQASSQHLVDMQKGTSRPSGVSNVSSDLLGLIVVSGQKPDHACAIGRDESDVC